MPGVCGPPYALTATPTLRVYSSLSGFSCYVDFNIVSTATLASDLYCLCFYSLSFPYLFYLRPSFSHPPFTPRTVGLDHTPSSCPPKPN